MLWKVYQYPVPFRCANTGAGFFLKNILLKTYKTFLEDITCV